ncbi:MAG: response regulator [Candidatus Thorarchaeota archaeon]|nr:MAG: response regulator [Candidatus Thorarchaeota archaeon]
MMKTRLLLVDDDVEILDVARILLHKTDPNLEIVVTDSVKSALDKIEHEKFDVIISDYLMPDFTGLDLLDTLRSGEDDTGFIVWTGHSSEDIAIKALNLGADHYIVKGIDTEEQLRTIQSTITKIQTRKAAVQTQMIPEEVVGEFIHKLSHDVIGILQNIMGYATLLNEEFDKSYIEGIAKLITKLNTRMKMAVSDIDSGELSKRK